MHKYSPFFVLVELLYFPSSQRRIIKTTQVDRSHLMLLHTYSQSEAPPHHKLSKTLLSSFYPYRNHPKPRKIHLPLHNSVSNPSPHLSPAPRILSEVEEFIVHCPGDIPCIALQLARSILLLYYYCTTVLPFIYRCELISLSFVPCHVMSCSHGVCDTLLDHGSDNIMMN